MFTSLNATKHGFKLTLGVAVALTSLSLCAPYAQAKSSDAELLKQLEQLVIDEIPYSSKAILKVEAQTEECIAGLGTDAQKSELLQCYLQENQSLDKLLNKYYQGAMAACTTLHTVADGNDEYFVLGSLDECKTSLKSMQLTWIRYRDRCLELPSELFYGEGIDAEIQRAKTLSEILKAQVSFLEQPVNNIGGLLH